ncbi:hypothetical protein PV10_05767 [Exophiala mesophila]|uniref:Uncharacterized protein n=1 Tax=Exophiala mesophila TaxID=212818 RepID=A0A0D1ZWL5_EXOME|nr:uncharacterized protein PV10_05767 [Exophiala mesophila]KIV91203.1 hypothetical protein PV10_05767 [Exophiala mesophila]
MTVASKSSAESARGDGAISSPLSTLPFPKSPRTPGGSLRRLANKISFSNLSSRGRLRPSPSQERVTEAGHVQSSLIQARRASIKPLSIITTAFDQLDFDPRSAIETLQTPPAETSLSHSPSVIMSTDSPRDRSIIDNMERFGKQVEPFPEVFTTRALAIKERLLKKANENLHNPNYFPDPPPDMFRDQLAQLNARNSAGQDREEDEKTIRAAKSFTQLKPLDEPSLADGASTPCQSSSFNGDTTHEVPRVITAPFTSLINLAPPDPSQHPSFHPNPPLSTSGAPLMITTSSAEEIRKWAQMKRKHESEKWTTPRTSTESPKPVSNTFTTPTSGSHSPMPTNLAKGPSLDEANKLFLGGHTLSNISLGHPDNRGSGGNDRLQGSLGKSSLARTSFGADHEETDIREILSDTSPLIFSTPKTSRTPNESFRSEATSFTSEGSEKKTGLRKMSKFFKSKADKSEGAGTQEFLVTSNFQRPDLEHYLRRTSNCWSRDYYESDPKPRHPYTSKGRYSRNLRCTTCLETCCAVCDRACCAYKAAVMAMEIHSNHPENLKVAEDRVLEITKVFPYGREAPTFLQCTKDDETGCGQMVCPDCCGICPLEYCGDVQCRKCKSDPWDICDWHDE